ncbi:MAG: hypothetical protein WD075_03090 [Rhodospirillales bacterium]
MKQILLAPEGRHARINKRWQTLCRVRRAWGIGRFAIFVVFFAAIINDDISAT